MSPVVSVSAVVVPSDDVVEEVALPTVSLEVAPPSLAVVVVVSAVVVAVVVPEVNSSVLAMVLCW